MKDIIKIKTYKNRKYYITADLYDEALKNFYDSSIGFGIDVYDLNTNKHESLAFYSKELFKVYKIADLILKNGNDNIPIENFKDNTIKHISPCEQSRIETLYNVIISYKSLLDINIDDNYIYEALLNSNIKNKLLYVHDFNNTTEVLEKIQNILKNKTILFDGNNFILDKDTNKSIFIIDNRDCFLKIKLSSDFIKNDSIKIDDLNYSLIGVKWGNKYFEAYVCDKYITIIDNQKYYKFDDRVRVCENCSRFFIQNDVNQSYCCDECCKKQKKKIKNYSYKPKPNFYKNENDENLFFGVEIETENFNRNKSKQDIVDEALDVAFNDFVYCKEDGSLNDGVEFVSHPFTLSKMMQNKDTLKNFCDYLISQNLKSHDTDTCGFHIHVNRSYFYDDELAVIDIAKFMYNNFDDYSAFCRRGSNNYCETTLIDYAANDDYSYSDLLDACDRYNTINIQNNNTIEFRQPRGTLNAATIIATIQLHYLIVKLADDGTLNNYTIKEIINNSDFNELKAYAKKVGI